MFNHYLRQCDVTSNVHSRGMLKFSPCVIAACGSSRIEHTITLSGTGIRDARSTLTSPIGTGMFRRCVSGSRVPVNPVISNTKGYVDNVRSFLKQSRCNVSSPRPGVIISSVLRRFPILDRTNGFRTVLTADSVPRTIGCCRLFGRRTPGLRMATLFSPGVSGGRKTASGRSTLARVVASCGRTFNGRFVVPA